MFYFTPRLGFFSPFPHGTFSLSVANKYLALRDGPRRFAQNFTCSGLLEKLIERQLNLAYETITLSGLAFKLCSAIKLFFDSP